MHNIEIPALTPGTVPANSQSPTLYGIAWGLGIALKVIGNLEAKREFKTKTARKLTEKIRELIPEELAAEFIEEGLLPALLDPAALGFSPTQAAQVYNRFIARALERYPALDVRRRLVDRYRAACKIPGWSVCGNPCCAVVFELTGIGDGLCSQKCRKSVRNRRAWFRRKSE